jgi:hypothetical protein
MGEEKAMMQKAKGEKKFKTQSSKLKRNPKDQAPILLPGGGARVE